MEQVTVQEKKKILLAFNQLQHYTLTEVSECVMEWMMYYQNHPTLKVDYKRFSFWPFTRNFNEMLRHALEAGYDYVFQYDSDMVGSKTILEVLVSKAREVAGCLYFSRNKPHKPQIWELFERKDADGIYGFGELSREFVEGCIEKGLDILTAVRATGFTLIKTEAYKDLKYPYAECEQSFGDPYAVNGFDMIFTRKMSKKYGSVLTVTDPNLEVRHITFQHVKDYLS